VRALFWSQCWAIPAIALLSKQVEGKAQEKFGDAREVIKDATD
jgi:hypothetical protein